MNRLFRRCAGLGAAALLLSLSVLATGCYSTIAKHATVLSAAIAPVVDQSAAAYRDAVALDDLRADYEAVVAYQNKDTTYNPRNTPELLSQKDIQVRLAVLASLQVYSQSLIEITKSPDSTELDSASKSVGSNLTSLGNTLAPSIEKVVGIAAASGSSTTTAAPISPEIRNGISTAVDALGQFFVNRTVEKRNCPPRLSKWIHTFKRFAKRCPATSKRCKAWKSAIMTGFSIWKNSSSLKTSNQAKP
jgi:hypothetical protein